MLRNRQPSLFRRLMTGFSVMVIAIGLYGLADRLYDAKSNQRANTASENKSRAREIMLTLLPVVDDPRKLLATAQEIEVLRRDLFRDLNYLSQTRLRVWRHGRLLYNSAPALPDVLPETAGNGNAWVRWTERDAPSGLVVERSHEVDDEWILSLTGVRYLLQPSAFTLVFLLLPAWLIISLGLRPLRHLAALIAQRSDADLSPLPDSHYRELSPLVKEINQLMARLGERIDREHEVLVDAAHELKTPLAAIQLNAHLVLSRAAAGNVEGTQEASDGLRDAVTRATHTVHQLLALERLGADSNSAALAPIDLEAFLRDRLAAAAPLAFQRDIDIELHADQAIVISAHRESLAALVDNLISNAIKYSPDRGAIDVVLKKEAEQVVLTIQDQGPGIDPELIGKVFERFYRIPGQEQCGSGLGLAIAQKAAALNHGSIELTSEPGAGLRATVRFELRTAVPAG